MSRSTHRCSVLLLAGDLSGSTYTWRLAEQISARHPEIVLHALGGRKLGEAVEKTGGVWIGDTSRCSAIGLSSVIPIYIWARWLSFKMRRFVRANPVDLVVLCDWGGFNCRQLNFFEKQKVPVLYYFPPRSWQRGGKAGLKFAPKVARVATPFSWSAERLKAVGCRAEWVGHPILEQMPEPSRRDILREEFGVKSGEKLVALLPGSRISEIRVLGPRLFATAKALSGREVLKFVVAVPEPLYEMTRACFPAEFPVIVDRASDALCACDAAVVKMGSATLEAAVMGAPQVAVYDLGAAARLEWVLLWMWKRIPFIAMPNIILQRLCIPELLGLNCRPELIADGIQRLLNDAAAREQMLAGYAEIRDHLGAQSRLSATEKTVKILEDMLGVSSDPHPTSP